MGIAALVASALILALGLIMLIGTFVPPRYKVARRLRLPHGVDEVWPQVSDPQRMNTWRRDLRRVLRLPGKRGGLASWEEVGWVSRRRVKMVKRDADRWEGRADNGLFPTRARVRVRLRGNDEVCIVELREDGVVRSPFVRCLAKFGIGFSAHTDAALRALAAHYNAPFEIEDIEELPADLPSEDADN